MSKVIRIRDFSSVIQYADLEDIPNEAATEMKNFRVVHGKLVKTSELSAFLNEALANGIVMGFITWAHPNLTTSSKPKSSSSTGGWAYLVALVNASTYELSVYSWDATSGWKLLDDYASPGVNFPTTSHYYQSAGLTGMMKFNPIIQCDSILRFLPGYTAEPDGSNVASGAWIGYMNRNFFDGLYPVALTDTASQYTKKFFSYPTKISKPAFTVTQKHIQGGTYNPLAARVTVIDLSCSNKTITIGGDVSSFLKVGMIIKYTNNASNAGYYKVTNWQYYDDTKKTAIAYDSDYSALSHDESTYQHGNIEIPGSGELMYYRFSYLYDGEQESLMGDPIAAKMDLSMNLFPRFSIDIVKATHNKRITGINLYRSRSINGPWHVIQTIDLTRKSTESILSSANDGASSGITATYIPDLAGKTWADGTHTLWIQGKGGTWKSTTFTSTSVNVYGVITPAQNDDFAGEDMWNTAWYVTLSGTIIYSGGSGAYAGENCVIVSTTTGEHDSAGGILYPKFGDECLVAENKMAIASAATHSSGARTEFTISTSVMAVHGLEVGDVVELYRFSTASGYNGTWIVTQVPTTTTFVCDVKYTATATGSWLNIGKERLVDDNYKYAVHLSKPIKSAVCSEGWTLMKPQWGLYYVIDGSTVTYRLYDTGLPDGEEHPLASETSIDIHGMYAKMIAGRLFQGRIILDPSSKAEEHPGWGSYSELDQPDVNPVSNILKFSDAADPEITGLEELWGMAVFMRKQSIFSINPRTNPADPETWTRVESIHHIGNLAPLGAIKVGDDLYTCSLDGIYRLRLNNLAPSDGTPTAKLCITEPIHNIYNEMTETEKSAIVSFYNQRYNEINFVFASSKWVYNVITGGWREVYSALEIIHSFPNRDGYPFVCGTVNDTGWKVYELEDSGGTAEDSLCTFRSKWFSISEDSPEPAEKITVIYKSPHGLKLRLYLDGNETMVEEYDLPAQEDMKPYSVAVGYSGYRIQFVITDDTGVALEVEEAGTGPVYLIVEQTALSPNVEIGGVDIVYG